MALGNRKPYLVHRDDQFSDDHADGDSYQGVVAQLREARLAYGRSTAEVGAALRIKPAHLDALERGDIEGMAGITYALGYLRSYANALGLDGEAAVVAFKAELNRAPESKPLVFPAPVQEAKFPTGKILSISVVVAVLAYGSFYFYSRSNTLTADAVPPVPAELAEAPAPASPPVPAPTAAVPSTPTPSSPTSAYAAQSSIYGTPAETVPTTVPPATPAPAPTTAAPEAMAPAPQALTVAPGAPAVPGALPSVVPAPPGAATTPAATDIIPPPPPAPTVAAVEPAAPAVPSEGRVVLKATDAAWVQIQGAGAEMIFTKILKAGESYSVPPRADAVLVTGNAGALEIFVDGKSMGLLGSAGQVRRNVPLDPEKLLSGAARPPA